MLPPPSLFLDSSLLKLLGLRVKCEFSATPGQQSPIGWAPHDEAWCVEAGEMLGVPHGLRCGLSF
jgi:hypothetical protein